jgi:hypothetical protein
MLAAMRMLLAAVLALAMAGCASLQPAARFERSADHVVDLINSGRAADLASSSALPFLLDGEILLLRSDVAGFWRGVAGSGFKIGPQATVHAVALDDRSFERFASTMEVRTFFSRHVSRQGSLVVVEAGRSRILLLLDRGKWGRTLIVGFRGPDAI